MLRDKYQRRGLDSREDAELTVKKYMGNDVDKEKLSSLVDDMLLILEQV